MNFSHERLNKLGPIGWLLSWKREGAQEGPLVDEVNERVDSCQGAALVERGVGPAGFVCIQLLIQAGKDMRRY